MFLSFVIMIALVIMVVIVVMTIVVLLRMMVRVIIMIVLVWRMGTSRQGQEQAKKDGKLRMIHYSSSAVSQAS